MIKEKSKIIKVPFKRYRLPLLLTILVLSLPFLANLLYTTLKSRERKIYDEVLKKPVNSVSLRIEPGLSFTNHLGMTFVYLQPGRFIMGSPPDEIGRDEFEVQHEVILTEGFYLQTTEVTQKQWVAVMEINPSEMKGDDLPVTSVSWLDCQKFIERLNHMEREGNYRLPTEAEWEYACRAGSTTAYASSPQLKKGKGSDTELDHMAWYRGNSHNRPHPVAKKKPNAWGLFDMHGNVFEWCQDWYESWYNKFTDKAVVNPKGPEHGRFKVIRGGSWFAGAEYLRSANRMREKPEYRNKGIGFRLARSE